MGRLKNINIAKYAVIGGCFFGFESLWGVGQLIESDGKIGRYRARIARLAVKGIGRDKQLFNAVENGDMSNVRALIVDGVNVNSRGIGGCTPLHMAAENGDLPIIKELLNQDAEVDARSGMGWTPLCFAVLENHLDVARELLNGGAYADAWDSVGVRPLHLAATKGCLAIAVELLSRNAGACVCDDKCVTPLHAAALYCHQGYWATYEDYLELIRVLLDGGAAVNAQDCKGNTPLHLCFSGMKKYLDRTEIVRELLGRGANVNIQNGCGQTPLDLAVEVADRTGDQTIVNLLRDQCGAKKGEDIGREEESAAGEK